jgi:SAM-dependent methyltransferase
MVFGRQVARIGNLLWERRLGIDTRGHVAVDHPDSSDYASIGYGLVDRVIRHMRLGPADVFVDVGSGKGRVLCMAARHPVRKVVGVDLSADFCATARSNAARMRGRRAKIEVHEGLADRFDYSDGTAYYLFSPFGPGTLTQVLGKIRADRAGAPVRMAYSNPAHQDVYDEQDWLERYDFWDAESRGEEHSVAFYRSRTA